VATSASFEIAKHTLLSCGLILAIGTPTTEWLGRRLGLLESG